MVQTSHSRAVGDRCGFRSGRTWHNRYWDHIIRDQEDMNRHLDYIHYNPERHGLVTSAMEYPHSSFRQFVDNGLYDSTWGIVDSPTTISKKNVGTAGIPTYESITYLSGGVRLWRAIVSQPLTILIEIEISILYY